MALLLQVLLIESGVLTWVWGMVVMRENPRAFSWVSPRAKTLFHIVTKVKSMEYMTGSHKLQSIMQMERDIIIVPVYESLWRDAQCLM